MDWELAKISSTPEKGGRGEVDEEVIESPISSSKKRKARADSIMYAQQLKRPQQLELPYQPNAFTIKSTDHMARQTLHCQLLSSTKILTIPILPAVVRLMRSHDGYKSDDIEEAFSRFGADDTYHYKEAPSRSQKTATELEHLSTPPQPIHYYDDGSTVKTRGRREYAVRLRSFNTDPDGN
ncbi:hypothetical protein DL98DRAFT_542390 [Cadophora sp. DSE1049]|nr:hypothetical protein DL98DRAFT_542390 [Cadophora sp. DSE1049]